MKIYQHSNGIFYEKQADCPSRSFEAVEFPFAASPKSDFVSWINNNSSLVSQSEVAQQTLDDIDGPLLVDQRVAEQAAKPTPTPHEPRPVPHADAVVEFVLNEASPAEVENIFAALGARFHEGRSR